MEEPESVRGMFNRIATRYDFANALLSGGMDFLWRRRAARIVQRWQPETLLDLATGSGVLAATISRACPRTVIVGADFCYPMLRQAQKTRRVRSLVVADAMRLPFPDGSFDAVTVAFGLRNMAGWAGALDEMRRVIEARRALAGARFFPAARLVGRGVPLLSAAVPADHCGDRLRRAKRLRIPGGIHRALSERQRHDQIDRRAEGSPRRPARN